MKNTFSPETKDLWRLYHQAIRDGEVDQSMKVARHAIKLYRKRDRTLLGMWRRSLANALFLKGNYQRAAREAWCAYARQSNRYERTLSLIAMALPLSRIGNEQEALDKLKYAEHQAIQFFQKDAYLWAHLHAVRAPIYEGVGRLDDAVIDYEGGSCMFEELGEYRRAAACSNDEAWLYLETGHLDDTELLMKRAVRLMKKEPYPHTEACIQDTLGYLYLKQGDYDKALASLRESQALFEEIGDKPQLIGTLLHLSELFELKHNWVRAKRHAARAAELSTEIGDAKLLARANELLSHLPSLTLVAELVRT